MNCSLVVLLYVVVGFFFSSRRRHTRCSGVSWARRMCIRDSDSTERINRTVSEVILYTDLTVGIILLNGQLIRKENDT